MQFLTDLLVLQTHVNTLQCELTCGKNNRTCSEDDWIVVNVHFDKCTYTISSNQIHAKFIELLFLPIQSYLILLVCLIQIQPITAHTTQVSQM